QFCPIFGGRSLLADTRSRILPVVAPNRTVFSVRKAHERFWLPDLSDVDRARILVQPSNKGTAAGIVGAVMHVLTLDPEAVVCCLPADHYYDADSRFQAAVESMYAAAFEDPISLVLLGAPPYYPETEYGWIQPGDNAAVARFVEKPSMEDARVLMDSG